MSSHSYTSSTPETPPVIPAIQKFFENFYQISDNPDKTDEYVGSFTEDAVFTVASKTANGESGMYGFISGFSFCFAELLL